MGDRPTLRWSDQTVHPDDAEGQPVTGEAGAKDIDAILNSLEEHGHRLTSARREILVVLASDGRAMTAADLFATLRERGSNAGLVTIYRTLELLVEYGWVHALSSGDRPNHEVRYRFCGPAKGPHHHHITCTRCGRTESIAACNMAALERSVEQTSGFQIDRHELEIYGLCPACR